MAPKELIEVEVYVYLADVQKRIEDLCVEEREIIRYLERECPVVIRACRKTPWR